VYKAGKADADCRQFNDDAGNIYYRLLAKTIPVSSSCTPYRLNNGELLTTTYDQTTCAAKKGLWSNNQCQVCLQGGEYKNGSCFYYGLPGGEVDEDYLRSVLKLNVVPSPTGNPNDVVIDKNAITVIFANNKGVERIHLGAWGLAHRCGHRYLVVR
jgi:hypothetical protein